MTALELLAHALVAGLSLGLILLALGLIIDAL